MIISEKQGELSPLNLLSFYMKRKKLYWKQFEAFFLGVGTIKKVGKGLIRYQVRSITDLAIIIAHFDNYPLITQK
jgi:hypothetical protein